MAHRQELNGILFPLLAGEGAGWGDLFVRFNHRYTLVNGAALVGTKHFCALPIPSSTWSHTGFVAYAKVKYTEESVSMNRLKG